MKNLTGKPCRVTLIEIFEQSFNIKDIPTDYTYKLYPIDGNEPKDYILIPKDDTNFYEFININNNEWHQISGGGTSDYYDNNR